MLVGPKIIYCIKSVAELRNVGDAAYAMSHAAAALSVWMQCRE